MGIERIGVIAHVDKQECLMAARRAIEHIFSCGAMPLPSETTARALSMPFEPSAFARAQCILVVGGDGTILRAAQTARALDIPILGVNFGRVGFLSEVEPADMIPVLDRLMREGAEEDSRLLVEARVGDMCAVALNDVLLCKLHHSRTIQIAVSVDGLTAAVCSCDGILVSTPTGSTAYALSAGGPIVSPELESLQVTPVCPHAISARPMMLPPNATIHIRLQQDRYNGAQVCADGELIAEHFCASDTLVVRAAKERLRFFRLGDSNYFETVRRKLFEA